MEKSNVYQYKTSQYIITHHKMTKKRIKKKYKIEQHKKYKISQNDIKQHKTTRNKL